MLNKGLADYFKDSAWNNAYVQNKLPDTLSGIREATKAGFDKELAESPQQKNDSADPTVSITADIPTLTFNANREFVNVAGRELYYSLEQERKAKAEIISVCISK